MVIALSQNFWFPRTNIRDGLTRRVSHFELQRKELRPGEDTHRLRAFEVLFSSYITLIAL
jgi:hypothetical protein